MKKLISHRQLIPAISLILSVIYPSMLAAQSQEEMIATDFEPSLEPRARLVEIGIEQQQPLPYEPLLFEMAEDLPPSAMLRDQDVPVVSDVTQALRTGEKSRPIPMPSEPKR